jgi:LacI family transcriptional regulator
MMPRRKNPPERAKERRVAILVDTSLSWGRDIIRGALRQARVREGWIIGVGNPRHEEWHDGLRDADGVIARVSDSGMARVLKRTGVPVVNVSAMVVPGADFHRVATDVEAAGRLAAEYFLERGFRHFGYVSLIASDYVARQRRAFARTVRAAGSECAGLDINSPTGSAGRVVSPTNPVRWRAMDAWLRELPKPAAILVWSGGAQIVERCRHAGISVPDEVAVLSGSNDSLLCEVSGIPISAIEQPCERIGGEAVGLLDRLMRGTNVPKSPLWLPPGGVVTRRSTDTLAIHDRTLVAALRCIRESGARPVRVGDVARAAGVSRRVLERRFAIHLQSTPAEYLRRAHLDRAKSLLAETDLPVPDVAEASGFGSPEYMAQIFRRRLDVTPLRYRRQIRGR